ncbi:uncharacterized protein LOC120186941 [Hibiscus syriacus]|uniref:uncharacterized protein LOC120186941 n=1 Tax=Hibiscus syriacus TaxID=106335 RepID=UPI001924D373|nr:uncharacterized protein LOC120186941 [Hibiscus syriacus]
MSDSYSVSRRAYKTGVKLTSDSSEENFIIAILVSLSKLVSKSTSLISEQVDVLSRCVTQENSLQMRVTALRCLHLIFVKEGCCCPVNMYTIKALFSILDELELPSVMHWGALQILHKVISLVMAQVRSLVKSSSDPCQTSNRFIIKYFANLNENALASKQIASGEVIDFKEDMGKVFRSKLLSNIHRFVSACLQILNEAGAITANVFDKVHFLVEHLHHGRVFDYYTRTVYSLLLHSHLVGVVIEHPFKQELYTLEHACKMLSGRDYWHAYKAGIYAASQGAWITATFIFAELIRRVQSDSCYCWLKSLVQFFHSEAKHWLSSLAKQDSFVVGSMGMNELLTFLKDNFGELGQDATGNDSVLNYRDVLVGACHNACSSIETLERIVISQKAFCFQRWFFSLRTKFIGAVGEILEVLDTSKQENFSNIIEVQNNALTNAKCLEKFTNVSFRLNRQVKELDLINSSFIGMESESLKVIATPALSCSVLAFSTGFPAFHWFITLCLQHRHQKSKPDYRVVRLSPLAKSVSSTEKHLTRTLTQIDQVVLPSSQQSVLSEAIPRGKKQLRNGIESSALVNRYLRGAKRDSDTNDEQIANEHLCALNQMVKGKDFQAVCLMYLIFQWVLTE